jgi:hypothetical protein
MKISKLFSYAVIGFAAYSLVSCAPCDCDGVAASAADTKKTEEVSHTTRGESVVTFSTLMADNYESVDRFKFTDKLPEDLEVIGKLADINQANEDAAFIKSIFNTLQGAENEAQQLDVAFTMSEEPVEDGLFVFSIDSEDEKDLTFQMYDEEGFDMVAYNKLAINNGKNYRALNVNDFEDGTYIFKLSDESGKELVRRVEVAKGE